MLFQAAGKGHEEQDEAAGPQEGNIILFVNRNKKYE
jgi:hypothetical protein